MTEEESQLHKRGRIAVLTQAGKNYHLVVNAKVNGYSITLIPDRLLYGHMEKLYLDNGSTRL